MKKRNNFMLMKIWKLFHHQSVKSIERMRLNIVKMLTEGLSDLLTQENLEAIEDGAKRLYDNILLTISHHDAKAEYELYSSKAKHRRKISEQGLHQRTGERNLKSFKKQCRTFQNVIFFGKISSMNLRRKNNIIKNC